MKKLMLLTLLLLGSAVLWAQSTSPPTVERKTSNTPNKHHPVKTKVSPLALGIQAADVDADLTPAALEIAQRVHLGRLPCELGAFVVLSADAQSAGYFDVHTKQQKYRMFPVATTTGAVRLEDPRAGVVWLQLGNKSMLMDQKLGKRLADVCMSPDQVIMANKLMDNPPSSLWGVAK